MQLSGGEIKHSYQNNDKQKYNTSPQHNKYCFTHEPTKKRGASDHTPIKNIYENNINDIRTGKVY
ncbi:hypothetical protein FNN88_21195 [Salmonella enterica subsp. diarizonae]|uniref:Uncharacterized protein n=1 Tax=Salmonella enterica I TaxID=59201 RepID=A0A3R0XFD2_SALET|nr:hypothetical protein [Salmonella enterica]EAB6033195.1 hypothetical protein [Salmonella enterica subsp. enterica serovar Java]EBI0041264.1 hypothetical protein [Salmonella enterica subsp. diarizonae serovar 61:k:z35]EBS3611150.1 hypothetical protein [Salmonella enterica subsp. enterica serovar Poona]EBW6041115.1 hypothetical protein [Salmonella enterica subsp. enterica serovar Oranienburg]ECD9254254.1 hypothetical protein [Salmonella enterica subsp. diarizonae]ECT8549883.1 hypothetical pro